MAIKKTSLKHVLYFGRSIESWYDSRIRRWVARTFAFGGVIRRERASRAGAIASVKRAMDALGHTGIGDARVSRRRNSRGRFTRGGR